MRKITYKLTGKFLKTDPEKIVSPEDITRQKAALMRVFKDLADSAVEQFWSLFLDAQNKPIAVDVCGVGTVDACAVHPRDIIKGALMTNASAILVVHNHPSGNCEFSREDIALTGRVVNAAHIVGLRVLDHIVICKDGFSSMRGEGWHDFRPSTAARAAAEPVERAEAASAVMLYAHVGWPKDPFFEARRSTSKPALERWIASKLDELVLGGFDTTKVAAAILPAEEAEKVLVDGKPVFAQASSLKEAEALYSPSVEHVEYPE